ncbi:MAG: DUF3368 domain-containing protein [Bacteroidales bacterium]|nr:DUF3368 domain-containing protein [Bacteroidales bacterium]MCF8458207.1 DUF3368 domain-containing protein [Bacteroidales bacterium]
MIIVADSSALIALSICDSLDLLEKLFGKVIVSQTVYNECAVESKSESEQLEQYLKNKIEKVDSNQFLNLPTNLGEGEISAMLLYKEQKADFLLIDDNRARVVAKLNNINIIGSIGVLLLAKHTKIILKVSPYLQRLEESNIFISRKLLNDVKKFADE